MKTTRRGRCAWRSRPPSAHALRDEELAAAISQVRDEARGVCGAPKTFERLRAPGVRASRKRAARIMRERALGYLSPAELEEANWPKEEGRLKAA